MRQAMKARAPMAMTPRGTATPTPILAPVVMPPSSELLAVGEAVAAVPVVTPEDAAAVVAVDEREVALEEAEVEEEAEEAEVEEAAVSATLMEE
jgi:hypothetical protein